MSGPNPTPPAGNDPSMDDILSSIRRILSEDEPPPAPPASEPGPAEDVFVLDSAMIVSEPGAAQPQAAAEPQAGAPSAPATGAVAAAAVQQLLRRLGDEPGVRVSRAGPSIEELVREELRPLLQAWLDRHLEPLLERLVRAELERLTARPR